MKQVITGFQEVQDRERLMVEGGYSGPGTHNAKVNLRILQDLGADGYRRYTEENRRKLRERVDQSLRSISTIYDVYRIWTE